MLVLKINKIHHLIFEGPRLLCRLVSHNVLKKIGTLWWWDYTESHTIHSKWMCALVQSKVLAQKSIAVWLIYLYSPGFMISAAPPALQLLRRAILPMIRHALSICSFFHVGDFSVGRMPLIWDVCRLSEQEGEEWTPRQPWDKQERHLWVEAIISHPKEIILSTVCY